MFFNLYVKRQNFELYRWLKLENIDSSCVSIRRLRENLGSVHKLREGGMSDLRGEPENFYTEKSGGGLEILPEH